MERGFVIDFFYQILDRRFYKQYITIHNDHVYYIITYRYAVTSSVKSNPSVEPAD